MSTYRTFTTGDTSHHDRDNVLSMGHTPGVPWGDTHAYLGTAVHSLQVSHRKASQRMSITFEKELLRTAYRLSVDSPDPSTQNAAFLTDKWGWNTHTAVNEFPRGVSYSEERWLRPIKYAYIEHAERNCLFGAAAAGLCTAGMTMVCP